MEFRWAKNLTVRDVEVVWDKPASSKWQSALSFADVQGLTLNNFIGAPVRLQTDTPVVVLHQVEGARVFNSKVQPGTQVFIKVTGTKSARIQLFNNDLSGVRAPYQLDSGLKNDTVKAANNF